MLSFVAKLISKIHQHKIDLNKVILSLIVSLLLFCSGCSLSMWISALQHKAKINILQDKITLEMNKICNNITREIYSSLNLTQGISALVKIRGDITQEEFDSLSAELLKEKKGIIRNTVLAPQNIIKYVYPYKGNEKVVGVNYENLPKQIESVRLAIRERKTVVAGPLELVQGGVGVIGRTPIFVLSKDKNKKDSLYYWGIAGTVIHFDSLLKISGLLSNTSNLKIALRGVDGKGAEGEVFWGDSSVFKKNPILLEIVLPYGSWQMAAIPAKGWGKYKFFQSFTFWMGTSLSFLLSFLLFTTLYINQIKTAEVTKRKAAEYADKLKSAFLATMSHELRTPLNSIIGFTGIILQGMVGEINEEQKKQLTMVQDSAYHLLDLINDVLDISKIESGQLELSKEFFTLKDSLNKSIQMVKQAAEKKGLYLKVEIIKCPEKLYGDRRRFEQILINLLNNAVKFTESGGIKVKVDISEIKPKGDVESDETDKVVISIQDTGIGLKKEDIKMLFKPFQQIDSSVTRKYEGTGLGLSISKRLANLMEGDITVHSDGLGKGSTFTLIMPLKGE
ncbi:MAG: ATP-binding protein [Chitinispirillaceae bacterium]|nr:ATP-binding protein [Chitinispirillaceae bacterium]